MSKVKSYSIAIGLVIAAFIILGIGLGLTGYIAVDFAEQTFSPDDSTDQSELQQGFTALFIGIILFQSIIVVFFAGPLVAATAGATAGVVTPDLRDGAIIGGIGSFVGFYPMILIAVLLMTLAFDSGAGGSGGSGGSTFNLAEAVVPIITAGLPTALVGAGTGIVSSKF